MQLRCAGGMEKEGANVQSDEEIKAASFAGEGD